MDHGSSCKRRRIQMGVVQCMEHAMSPEGLAPLTQPSLVQRCSRDPNGRLHPQNRAKLLGTRFRAKRLPLTGGLILKPVQNSKNETSCDFYGRPVKLHGFPVSSRAQRKLSSAVLPSLNLRFRANCKTLPKMDDLDPEVVDLTNENVESKNENFIELPDLESHVATQAPGFQTAAQAFSASASLDLVSTRQEFASFPSRTSRRRKAFKDQRNSLLNYYAPSRVQKKTRVHRSCPSPIKVMTKDPVSETNSSMSMEVDPCTSSCLSVSSDAMASLALDEDQRTEFRDPFGLFGLMHDHWQYTEVKSDEDAGPDYISELPIHIFELILCRLPILDLLLTVNRVSQHWNCTISNEKFIPWKKNYYKLKSRKCPQVLQEITDICTVHSMDTLETCLDGLIQYMRHFPLKPSHDILQNLKKVRKYQWVEDVMKERLAGCLTNGLPHPWCVIACLVALSETVGDVYAIFNHLLHTHTKCSILDIIECLYCIATFLLHFKNKYGLHHGLHYRVFYALYIYENHSAGTSYELKALNQVPTGQQSIIRYSNQPISVRLTHEQMRVVNHQLQPNQVVKIIALAGTGKTSTLVEYTKLRPGLKFLTIVYNRAVNEHAKKCFPHNSECRTAHSLAWATVGKSYNWKLTTKLRPLDIMPYLLHAPGSIGPKQRYAHCVLFTLDCFMASPDDFITTAHVPHEIEEKENDVPRVLTSKEKLDISYDAEVIWKKMVHASDSEVRITHDGYLKLYQLDKPKLLGYDCILVDEAQDCNGAMLDIILRQNCPKIFVGDPNQQIYAFRGAVNALDSIESTHKYHLTKSFRFGPEIAYVASCALEVLKKFHTQTLVGVMKDSAVDGSKVGQIAYLARSNVALFHEAVRLCCRRNFRPGEPPVIHGAYAGGIAGYRLDQILDIYHLMMGNQEDKSGCPEIKDRFIRRFKSFAALQQYAENAKDGELKGKIRIAMLYNINIPEYLQQIKSQCRYSMDMANVVFSTAHKSKGLEFDTVCILDDFTVGGLPYVLDLQAKGLNDEFNVLYVAITRAKKRLCMAFSVYCVLLTAQERFEYPVSTTFCYGADEYLDCARCGAATKPEQALTMVARKISLASNVTVQGGPLCTTCITSNRYNLPAKLHAYLEFPIIPRPLEDPALQSLCRLVGPLTTQV